MWGGSGQGDVVGGIALDGVLRLEQLQTADQLLEPPRAARVARLELDADAFLTFGVAGPAHLGRDLERAQAARRGDVEDDLGARRQELGGAQESTTRTDVFDVAVVHVAVTYDTPVGDQRNG